MDLPDSAAFLLPDELEAMLVDGVGEDVLDAALPLLAEVGETLPVFGAIG